MHLNACTVVSRQFNNVIEVIDVVNCNFTGCHMRGGILLLLLLPLLLLLFCFFFVALCFYFVPFAFFSYTFVLWRVIRYVQYMQPCNHIVVQSARLITEQCFNVCYLILLTNFKELLKQLSLNCCSLFCSGISFVLRHQRNYIRSACVLLRHRQKKHFEFF